MLMPISRVMTAVVACPSSVGGSPMSPTFRMPPFFGAWESAGATPSHTAVVASAAIMSQRRMVVPPLETPAQYPGRPPA